MELKEVIRYDETQLENSKKGSFVIDDIVACNTHLTNEVAKYYQKYKHYPYPPPKPKDKEDKYYFERFRDTAIYDEYKRFWDGELERRRKGIIIPGALEDGKIKNIHITGKHYGYLNYGQILLTKVGAKNLENLSKEYILATETGSTDITFPDFRVGDYFYFKTYDLAKRIGRNIVIDKTRQVGYSYKNAWIVFDEFDIVPESKCLIGAYSDEFLNKEGTMTKVKDFLDFINKFTDFKKELKSGGGKETNILETGYRYSGEQAWSGTDSMIATITFFHSTRGARSKKWNIALLEEAGAFPNVKEVLRVSRASFYSGKIKTGLWILLGTGGGDKILDWQPFEDIFYNPELYDALPFKNVWDDDARHMACGFFHPRYLDLEPYIDKDGNTTKVLAQQAVIDERIAIRASSEREEDYTGFIAEFPIKPRESFSRIGVNIFSSQELTDYYDLVKHDALYNFGKHGIIEYAAGGLKFTMNDDLLQERRHSPILDYPLKSGTDLYGCVTIYYEPYRDKTGNIPDNMYYALCDAFAVDTKESEASAALSSLGACYIYEAVNPYTPLKGDILVAKYVGRPPKVEIFNEQAFNLAVYYGVSRGNFWFENDGGAGTVVTRDAKILKRTSLLNLEPEFEYNKALAAKTGREYGVSIGKVQQRLNYALNGLKEWIYTVRSIDNITGKKKYNLHYIPDSRFLGELCSFTINKNLDCISAIRLISFLIPETTFKNKQVRTAVSSSVESFFNPEYIND